MPNLEPDPMEEPKAKQGASGEPSPALEDVVVALQKAFSRVSQQSAGLPEEAARALVVGKVNFELTLRTSLHGDRLLVAPQGGIEMKLAGTIDHDIRVVAAPPAEPVPTPPPSEPVPGESVFLEDVVAYGRGGRPRGRRTSARPAAASSGEAEGLAREAEARPAKRGRRAKGGDHG